jgi:hypothetical protein
MYGVHTPGGEQTLAIISEPDADLRDPANPERALHLAADLSDAVDKQKLEIATLAPKGSFAPASKICRRTTAAPVLDETGHHPPTIRRSENRLPSDHPDVLPITKWDLLV